MKSRKGFIGTSTLVLLAAGAGVTTLGISQIESLVTTILNNMYLIITTIIIGAGVTTVVKNAGQKDPNWKKDIQGSVFLILLAGGLLFGVPYASGAVLGYTATVDVTVNNPALDPVEIGGASVSVEKGGPLSVLQGANILNQASLAGGQDAYSGTVTLTCDDETYEKSFSGKVLEELTSSHELKIRGIKADSCTGQVTLSDSSGITQDSESITTYVR